MINSSKLVSRYNAVQMSNVQNFEFGVDQFHNWKSARNIKFYCCFLTTSVNRSTPLASEINRMHFMKIQLDCFNCFKLFPRDRGEVMDGFGITFGLKLDRCKKKQNVYHFDQAWVKGVFPGLWNGMKLHF